MKIERFEDIQAWQVARELTRLVYALSQKNNFNTASEFEQIYNKAKDTKGLIGGFIRYLKSSPRKTTRTKKPTLTPQPLT